MSKDVFFVVKRLGGSGWGGAHRVLAILANYFASRDYDVTVIVWEDSPIDYPLNKKVKIEWLHYHIKNEFDVFIPSIKTRKILKNHRGAYLYAFMSKMAVYALLYTIGERIRIIGSERTDPNTEPKKKIFRWIRNIVFCYLFRTVYQTPDAMKYFPKKAQKNGSIIPNPITPDLPERYEGIRKKEFVTFCRIDKQKNLPMMIDAFCIVHQKYPEYVLKIYGTGLIEKDIAEYIRNKKAEEFILMMGFQRDVHKLILNSFAYLSTSDYEGLSNSMLEALAIGLPSICTDCPIGGAKMMINNYVNGILVPVRDTKAMANAMGVLIENPDIVNRLSRNATQIRYKLDENIICKKWEKLMEED